MDKLSRPRNLIAFDTDLNIEHRLHHERTAFHFVRPRTLIYLAGILITIGLMAWGLTHRQVTGINVLHDRNPVYVQEGDGSIMNGFTVRMLNKEHRVRKFTLSVSGLDGLRIGKVSEGLYDFQRNEQGNFVVDVPEDTTRELRVLVVQPKQAVPPRSESIVISATDVESGEKLSRSDFFKGPGAQ
jgi:polyferredoxin